MESPSGKVMYMLIHGEFDNGSDNGSEIGPLSGPLSNDHVLFYLMLIIN